MKNRVPDVITFNGDISFGNFAASGVFYDFTDEPIVDTLNPRHGADRQESGADHRFLQEAPVWSALCRQRLRYIYNKALFRKVGL